MATAAGLIAFGLSVHGAWLAGTHRVPLGFVHGQSFTVLAVALLVSVGVTALAAWQSIAALRAGVRSRGRTSQPFLPLRHAFTVFVLGWLAFLTFAQPFQRLGFDMALGLMAGGWALVQVVGRLLTSRAATDSDARAGRAPALLRALDLLLFSLCVTALAAELALRAYAAVLPTPLLSRVGAAPTQLVERFRSPPGELRFGFPVNSRGFYDEEFSRKTDDQTNRLVVCIGDSFSVGAVPHALHYTTVLEELTGDTVYNIGVAGIGPPEYASLVAHEAVPLAPDEIVIALFIGNDLDVPDIAAEQPDPVLRSWWQREQVLLFVLPRRLARIRQEQARLEDVARVQGERTAPTGQDPASVAAAFPWTTDPLLEEGTLSEKAWLDLETSRLLATCAPAPASLDLVFRSLLTAREAAGDIPLSVVLIPDEFQVEETLLKRLTALLHRPIHRDRPQQLLTAWLDEQGIPCLDLAPFLRAVPPLEDGNRHLYHARDTHWNARGNRVAGEALAEFLR